MVILTGFALFLFQEKSSMTFACNLTFFPWLILVIHKKTYAVQNSLQLHLIFFQATPYINYMYILTDPIRAVFTNPIHFPPLSKPLSCMWQDEYQSNTNMGWHFYLRQTSQNNGSHITKQYKFIFLRNTFLHVGNTFSPTLTLNSKYEVFSQGKSVLGLIRLHCL